MTFHIDHKGITDLVNGPGAVALVEKEAKATARAASLLIPGAHIWTRRTYRSTPARTSPAGATATVYTTDVAGHIFEWGSVKSPVYAPLRRAVQRRGLRLRQVPKP